MSQPALVAALILTGLASLAPEGAHALSTANAQYEEALRLTPRIDHGAKLFELCAACHGRDGQGAADGSVPGIAGQSVPVLLNQLIEFRYDARHSIRVQGFMAHHPLAPQGLADVAAYVNSLPPREPTPGPAAPRSVHGEALFSRLCSRCHGLRGEGDPASRVPALAGQHPEYLLEQLHDAAVGERPSMERDHARLLKGLSADDIAALAAHLAALAPAAFAPDAVSEGAARDRRPAD